MQTSLLASSAWILDVIALAILICGIALGSNQGFIKSVCKIAGTVFSIIFAVFFCVSFRNFLESAFGMTSAIANGIANGFADKEPYFNALASDITEAELSDTLSSLGVGFFSRLIIDLNFSDGAVISAGTTVAQMLGASLANWISVLISFVLLFVLVRLGFWLLSRISTELIEKFSPLRIVNRLLGGIFGLLEAVLVLFVLLLICQYLPFESLHSYIASSPIIGKIFVSDWFVAATSYAVSGQWFFDLTGGLVV